MAQHRVSVLGKWTVGWSKSHEEASGSDSRVAFGERTGLQKLWTVWRRRADRGVSSALPDGAVRAELRRRRARRLRNGRGDHVGARVDRAAIGARANVPRTGSLYSGSVRPTRPSRAPIAGGHAHHRVPVASSSRWTLGSGEELPASARKLAGIFGICRMIGSLA
jgi:hypothetical protein